MRKSPRLIAFLIPFLDGMIVKVSIAYSLNRTGSIVSGTVCIFNDVIISGYLVIHCVAADALIFSGSDNDTS